MMEPGKMVNGMAKDGRCAEVTVSLPMERQLLQLFLSAGKTLMAMSTMVPSSMRKDMVTEVG